MKKRVFSKELWRKDRVKKYPNGYMLDFPWVEACDGLTPEEMMNKYSCTSDPDWEIEIEAEEE